MADLVLDYGLLHDLAGSMRTLRANIQTDVDAVSGRAVVGSAGAVGSDVVGNSTLYGALSGFYAVCHSPFHDSMDKLNKLADTLDSVAKAFFDTDADFAGKVNAERVQANVAQWQSNVDAYQRYQRLKDKNVTYQYYDQNGHLETATIPLWDPQSPPPPDPGAAPTALTADVPGGTTSTNAQVNGDGQITSETSTTTTTNGLTYTETTTYTWHTDAQGHPYADYSTSITHSDGTTETISKQTHPDNSYVMTDTTSSGTSTTTVTPKAGTPGYASVTNSYDGTTTTVDVTAGADGTGTKTVDGPNGTDVYSGNANTDQWTLTSHTDPPPDPSDYVPITY